MSIFLRRESQRMTFHVSQEDTSISGICKQEASVYICARIHMNSFLSLRSLAASSLTKLQELMLQQANGESDTRSQIRTLHRNIMSLPALQPGKQHVGISSFDKSRYCAGINLVNWSCQLIQQSSVQYSLQFKSLQFQ
jgi:hypothetical protein